MTIAGSVVSRNRLVFVTLAGAIAAFWCLIPVQDQAGPTLDEHALRTDKSNAQSHSQRQAKSPAATVSASKPAINVADQLRLELQRSNENQLPNAVHICCDGKTINTSYTGKFIRIKTVMFVKAEVYQMGSYVESPEPAAADTMLADMLVDGNCKVFVLRFSRSVPGGVISATIKQRIAETFGDVELSRVGQDLDRFVALFANGALAAQTIYMCWMPGGKLYCSFNNSEKLDLISSDFSLTRAIWRIWCGPQAGPERLGLVENLSVASNP